MESTCTICTTPLSPSRTVTFPCNHAHCLPCLRRNWDLALSSASASTNPAAAFRPVQCCPGSRLPVPTIRRALGLDLTSSLRRAGDEGVNGDHGDKIALYRARMAEHDAARGSRLYCHDPRCGSFIPELLRDIRVGRCRACRARTCVRCGERAHTSSSGAGGLKGRRWCEAVSSDGGGEGGGVKGATNAGESERKRRLRMEKKEQEEQEGFMRVVKEMGWKRCPACKRYVEKTEGCNHIQ
ncbi:hypothetical protein C7999DRAFT_28981 [Corynascus novoguineensis]|uniref:RBR-type E3 ubiquitin transferase n=1 Tax=Corynascus novoguineensis TaxID=1126955 RepID=A0AAN7HMB6_9PEZI|nr:hypothetical protein C7999DRAFT_28981 [Corynascus novoguineensis]